MYFFNLLIKKTFKVIVRIVVRRKIISLCAPQMCPPFVPHTDVMQTNYIST